MSRMINTEEPRGLTVKNVPTRFRASFASGFRSSAMEIRNSLRSLKRRDKDCRVIRRRGRTYVINKKNPRFKARQG